MTGLHVRERRKNSMLVKVVKLHELATFERAYDDDVGFDLTCCGYDVINGITVLQLGIAIEPPRNLWFMIVPRSSFPYNHGLFMANSVGIVDPSYRGEWLMNCFDWFGDNTKELKGRKVAQAIPMNMHSNLTIQFGEELNETERGEAGFGSTG